MIKPLLLLLLLFIIVSILQILLKKQQAKNELTNLPYQKRPILTENEKAFFRELKTITERQNLLLFTKVRLADIVEIKSNTKQWQHYMNKIQSKHIDFVICNQNMDIITVIELDDKSHQRKDRIKRDTFVNEVLKTAGLQIIHTQGNTSTLEEMLTPMLNTEL